MLLVTHALAQFLALVRADLLKLALPAARHTRPPLGVANFQGLSDSVNHFIERVLNNIARAGFF